MRPVDLVSDSHQLELIRRHAQDSLERADAVGRFPTPVEDVMEIAQVVEAEGDALSEGFIKKLRTKFGAALKRAVGKVMGVLDSVARVVYLDKTLLKCKRAFVRLHECGHAVLPWQRDIYKGIEDCEKTLLPDISDLFDREASVFASEVLFQLDTFSREAADYEFGLRVPLDLAKKYGSSAYAAIRRYVSTNHRTCAVYVLNAPEIRSGDGFAATARRVLTSNRFNEIFGELSWPEVVTPDSMFGRFVPLNGRKMTGKRNMHLTDLNGQKHLCQAEGFFTGYQVFILILDCKVLTTTAVIF